MEEKPQNKNWILFAGIGCIVIVCTCGGLIGGLFLVRRSNSSLPFVNSIQNMIPNEIMPGIGAPQIPSVEIPTLPAIQLPTMPSIGEIMPTLGSFGIGPDLTGNQYSDDTTLLDDFSSEALGWPTYNDGTTIIQYENQAYSIQITEPEFYDWAFAPVSFKPSYIMFEVWGLPGDQDGTFGVFCQYQDPANYYYVEFDLQTREAVIAMIDQDEYYPLTEPGSNDEYWIPVNSLNASPEEANSIIIDCQLETITLIVNEEFVASVPVGPAFRSPGEMAFFVFTFDFAGPEGYKVFFDNVLIK